MISSVTPAKSLLGLRLDGGWKVTEYLPKGVYTPGSPIHTGGHFSESYIVKNENDGTTAFLKAIDFTEALKSDDPPKLLAILTNAYNFERDLLNTCKSKKLNRVSRSISDGTIKVDNADPYSSVSYILFELADSDLRKKINTLERFDLAFNFRVLQEISAAINQLHGINTVHQDVKPSNLLMFNEKPIKITDVGCASVKGVPCPRDSVSAPGDLTYAPPELLYGFTHPEWEVRRYGCDAYLFGSMVMHLFIGLPMTACLISKLDITHRPGAWSGKYMDVLPYLQNSFSTSLEDLKSQINADEKTRNEVVTAVKYLCEPDPEARGHPKDRKSIGNSYSLIRFESIFSRLAKRQELSL